jgi:hypothetical protein
MRRTASPKRVDIKDSTTPQAQIVLEAAAFLAGQPMEIRGPGRPRVFLGS